MRSLHLSICGQIRLSFQMADAFGVLFSRLGMNVAISLPDISRCRRMTRIDRLGISHSEGA